MLMISPRCCSKLLWHGAKPSATCEERGGIMNRISWLFIASVVLGLAAASAAAQTYPSRPIRMMVPFPAGGGSDTMGRIVGGKLSERLGQQIVVENRVGAAGSIGADVAARAPADGYTILLGSTSELVQYPNVN